MFFNVALLIGSEFATLGEATEKEIFEKRGREFFQGVMSFVGVFCTMNTMFAVPRGSVGVATAVSTISGSSFGRRRAGFGHCRVRCEMERVVAEAATRSSGGNVEPGKWIEIQSTQLHSSENVGDAARPSFNPAGDEDDAEVLIECRNVYKSFGEKHILQGASFKIRDGEAVGIIGPSGTGKSTVLRIMAGLLAPDKGEVYIRGIKREGLASDDEDLGGLRIGLVFQSAALFDSLTVRENVGFMLYEHSNLSDERIAELVRESLAAVGLKDVEERLPSELSGGMKKRVALARAIISDDKPGHSEQELVMYDEPTAGLDPIASTVVEDLIRSVHRNGRDAQGKPGTISSYVVVTHQHSTIRRAVDRILFLHEGKVVWEGPTAEFDTSMEPIVRQFADGSLLGPIRY
ncbi:hypothetical protein KC19_3G187000 [Ceratodon purpureus]|uniref:ABC transporter domain-containing protein n=1 Tax=Ceratodon purpureus TaxID=3225 RepID=A0A8T0IK05_CERPU|nr:hypothetical protein KC19_3G187000 [Ceratodon purpureus]